jgi:Protein of unknown function (DUF3253)
LTVTVTVTEAVTVSDAAIEQAITAALARREPPKTICPSEVARHLCRDEAAWRALMPRVRAVAFALAARGAIEVTQGGQVVRGDQARGAIRLRRR